MFLSRLFFVQLKNSQICIPSENTDHSPTKGKGYFHKDLYNITELMLKFDVGINYLL